MIHRTKTSLTQQQRCTFQAKRRKNSASLFLSVLSRQYILHFKTTAKKHVEALNRLLNQAAVGFWLPSPNKFSNSFEAIGGTVMGTGAMKFTSFSWTLYLEESHGKQKNRYQMQGSYTQSKVVWSTLSFCSSKHGGRRVSSSSAASSLERKMQTLQHIVCMQQQQHGSSVLDLGKQQQQVQMHDS